MPQQRVPHPVGDVLVVQRCPQPVAEHELAELAGGLELRLERIEDRLTHLDVALAAVRLGVFLFTADDGLANQDEAVARNRRTSTAVHRPRRRRPVKKRTVK